MLWAQAVQEDGLKTTEREESKKGGLVRPPLLISTTKH
jgi:hypothetical protein